MSKRLHSIAIDITNLCNFRCRHCFNDSGEHSREEELTDKEILALIEEICEFDTEAVCICGGETMLKKDLVYQIAKFIKKKLGNATSVNVVSNGFLIDEEVAYNLKKSGIDLVQISIDGAKAETHNWLRKNDSSFDKAIQAIRELKKVGMFVGVACAPSKKNVEEIDDVMTMCHELGVNLFRMQPLMIMGRGRELRNVMLDEIEYYNLSQKIFANSINPKYKGMQIEWGDPIQHLEAIQDKNYEIRDIHITAYGDVMASPYIPLSFGNIKRHSLNEYFKNGLYDVYKDKLFRKMASMMNSWENMELNSRNKIFPIIGTEANINYDLIDLDKRDLEKYNIFWKWRMTDENKTFNS